MLYPGITISVTLPVTTKVSWDDAPCHMLHLVINIVAFILEWLNIYPTFNLNGSLIARYDKQPKQSLFSLLNRIKFIIIVSLFVCMVYGMTCVSCGRPGSSERDPWLLIVWTFHLTKRTTASGLPYVFVARGHKIFKVTEGLTRPGACHNLL